MNPTTPIDQVLANLRRFEKDAQAERAQHDQEDLSHEVISAYEARLNLFVEDLRGRVQEQESALRELRASIRNPTALTAPSPNPKIHLQQLRALGAAYTSLTTNPGHVFPAMISPEVVGPHSPVPALLALRNAQRQIVETKQAMRTTHSDLTKARKRLEQEESDLRDSQLIHAQLEQRLEKLRAAQESSSSSLSKSPDEVANDLITEKQARIAAYERETRQLVKAFNDFIDTHLAAMLAAEELGGPIVGDLGHVPNDDMLVAGFSSKGRVVKRQKKAAATSESTDSLRQQRIDQIWGPRRNPDADADSEDNEQEEDDDDQEGQGRGVRSEKEAAGAEIRELTEELLNALAGSNSSPYVQLSRDSAAARFLVRSKIAQYHPKDARKLRLIDFGKELDD